MNFFDYIGAILSYIIIAMALFAGKYDNLTATELSAEISKVWKSPASCLLWPWFISRLNPWEANYFEQTVFSPVYFPDIIVCCNNINSYR